MFGSKKFIAIFISSIYLIFPATSFAQTSNTISNIREGQLFIHANGSQNLMINWSTALANNWESHVLIKDPQGRVARELVVLPTDPAGSIQIPLTQVGDYQIIITIPFHAFSFTSTAPMLLVPNPRKRTFRATTANQVTQRLYFLVPSQTTSFTINAMVTRGSDQNSLQLYNPSGTMVRTLSVPNNSMAWQQATITNPASGSWSATMTTASSDSESSFWLEGVPNYVASSSSGLFIPQFITTNVSISADLNQILGSRGLIGAGRVGESGIPTSSITQAFNSIRLEANETQINQSLREPQNDNSDPNVLNLSGFNFNNPNIDYTVNTLQAEPIIHMSGVASWLSPTGNAGLTTQTARAEWAEAILASLIHYRITQGYPLQFAGITNEPNIYPLTAQDYVLLFQTVVNKIKSYPDNRISSIPFYIGSVATLDIAGRDFVNYLISNLDSNSWQYLGIHPWQMGYPGGGTIYTTPILKQYVDDFLKAADSRGSTIQKRIIISEVNAKWGDTQSQDAIYFASWDHALWFSSLLTNVLNTGRSSVLLYYPFSENGTIHNLRAMVYADGRFKPVAYATQFILSHLQNIVTQSLVNNSAEVETLATINTNNTQANIILTNKENRTQQVHLVVTKPNALLTSRWELRRIDNASFTTNQLVNSGAHSGSSFSLDLSLTPQSIYSLDILAQNPGVSPSPAFLAGDVNHDGLVNQTDALMIVSNYARPTSSLTGYFDAQLDNKVNAFDFAWIKGQWQ